MPDRRILMGVVGRPHGVRGLVRVHSYTADPADLAGYGPLLDDAGQAWTLTWRGAGVAELRDAAGQPLPDRSAAERMVNAKLWLDRDRLPPPEEGEFYLADLVGMAALDSDMSITSSQSKNFRASMARSASSWPPTILSAQITSTSPETKTRSESTFPN